MADFGACLNCHGCHPWQLGPVLHTLDLPPSQRPPLAIAAHSDRGSSTGVPRSVTHRQDASDWRQPAIRGRLAVDAGAIEGMIEASTLCGWCSMNGTPMKKMTDSAAINTQAVMIDNNRAPELGDGEPE